MLPNSNPKIVIIGAGPTGLGAGYRLKELGHDNFQIYERSSYIGGLASSFTDSAGFTWDIGGHVMFSHYKYYDEVFDVLMGDEFQMNMRECWVRMFDNWVPYPLQNNIRHLPREVTYECLAGLVEAQTRRNHKNAAMQSDDFGWGPNNQFKFPLKGGTGEFYRRFAKPLDGHIFLNKPIDFINILKKEIRFADGDIQSYDELITTVPLDKLCNDM